LNGSLACEISEHASDIGFHEILADEVENNPDLPEQVKEFGKHLNQILPQLYKAAEKRK